MANKLEYYRFSKQLTFKVFVAPTLCIFLAHLWHKFILTLIIFALFFHLEGPFSLKHLLPHSAFLCVHKCYISTKNMQISKPMFVENVGQTIWLYCLVFGGFRYICHITMATTLWTMFDIY